MYSEYIVVLTEMIFLERKDLVSIRSELLSLLDNI